MIELKRREESSARVFDEAVLRYKIRKVSLSGLELVRLAPDAPWVPLHSLPLFREEATGGRAAQDTRELALARSKAFGRFIAFMSLAGAFGVTAGIAGAASGDPAVVGALGAFSMAMVAGGWVSGMILAIKHGGRSSYRSTKTARPEQDALGRSLAALEGAVAAAPLDVRASVDIADVRAGVAVARRKRTLLAALHQADDPRPGLLADLVVAREAAAKATDVSAADAFADEIRSIEGLLESMDRAAKAASESEARERALLHELDALRLAIVAANAGGSAMNELTDRLAAVRSQLHEEAAIESDLTNDLSGSARRLGPQKN